MGINNRGPFHPAWAKTNGDVAAGFMTATIKVIRRKSDEVSTYNFQSGSWSVANDFEVIIENIKARVQPYGIIGDMTVAQDPTSRRLIRIQVRELETGINQDDMIYVTDCPGAPELAEFVYEVRGTVGSSNPWLTDIVCETNTKISARNLPSA